MRLLALADADDARAFRLAGVDAIRCRTAPDVDGAIADVTAGGRAGAGLLLVSPSVYRLAPRALDALRRDPRAPVVLVLP